MCKALTEFTKTHVLKKHLVEQLFNIIPDLILNVVTVIRGMRGTISPYSYFFN